MGYLCGHIRGLREAPMVQAGLGTIMVVGHTGGEGGLTSLLPPLCPPLHHPAASHPLTVTEGTDASQEEQGADQGRKGL